MKKTLSLLLLTALFATPATAAKITIVNVDQPNIGFNDPTAATPVGGNEGTTLGAQRLNVFKRAAEIWGEKLTSDVEILINASFAPRTVDCTANEGVLASAGPTRISANFKNAPYQSTWYPIALANKFAGTDLEPTVADINMTFNSAIGTPTCLSGTSWYHGYDNNQGTRTNLLVTTLHEMTHGLGMTGAMLTTTGELRSGMPHIFEVHAFETTSGLRFDQMTNSQRLDARQNNGNLVWDGESVRHAAAEHLGLQPLLKVTAPAAAASNYDYNRSSTFGGPIGNTTFAGKIVAAVDAEGTAIDGCSAFTNADAIRGNIALVERGSCDFVVKAKNAQNAGAIAVVIYNNQVGVCNDVANMGGTDNSITIPAVAISQRDGRKIAAALATAEGAGALTTDPSQKAGMNANGRIRLYSPCEYAPGSSVHHFDESASPNLLMEPYLDGDVPVGVDITLNFLLDIGWGQGGPRTGRTSLRR